MAKNPPPMMDPGLRARLEGLMERSLARQAQMPMPSDKPKPLPKPRLPSAATPKKDRPLTEREKNLYKQFKGTFPPEGMRLNEFRRYMGDLRGRGGMHE